VNLGAIYSAGEGRGTTSKSERQEKRWRMHHGYYGFVLFWSSFFTKSEERDSDDPS
jgi:hypothetical protein